jgi:hypothetical protein
VTGAAATTGDERRDDGTERSTHIEESSRHRREKLKAAALWILVAVGVALLSWQTLPLEPYPGVDASWGAALHMALHDGVAFGNHLIFTFGPLGFLSVPTLWFSHTGEIAFFYSVLVRIALAGALFAGARRSYGTLAGAGIALLVAGASGSQLEPVPFLVFGVWVVDRLHGRWPILLAMAAAGAVAGFEFLNKTSNGIEMAALVVVMAAAARGRRSEQLLVGVAAMVAAVLVGWTITGQSWDTLPAFARGTEQIVSGYAAGMGGSALIDGWPFFAACAAFAVGLIGALHMTAGGGSRRRWGIVALWLTFCYFEFKEGFVRHDAGHNQLFFEAMLGGFIALEWRPGRRLFALGATALLGLFSVVATGGSPWHVVDFPGDASSALTQVGQVTDASKRASIIAEGRQLIERTYPIDRQTLALLRAKTVHVWPYEVAVAWAYRLDWRPLPVFQSYTAYTTTLDQDNANALNSTYAPQRILRNLDVPIDNRVLSFDEPLSTRTLLCRYRSLRTTATWQVLAAGPNRCAAPALLRTVHADWDQVVAVPPPPNDHTLVFVRIDGVAVAGLERLGALLFRPAERMVVIDGAVHRLVEETASDGLLLRAPARVDYPVPFNLAPDSTTIAVEKSGAIPLGGDPITFSFYGESLSGDSDLPAP